MASSGQMKSEVDMNGAKSIQIFQLCMDVCPKSKIVEILPHVYSSYSCNNYNGEHG